MSVILKREIRLTPEDNQKNIKMPFDLDKAFKQMTIHFSYTPQQIEDRIALNEIRKAIPLFYSQFSEVSPESFLPLENLITVSIAYEDHYLGCRHHKSSRQMFTISADYASFGYLQHPVIPGNWELQLNNHCVLSEEIKAWVIIIGEEES